jgi:hypothetical protein
MNIAGPVLEQAREGFGRKSAVLYMYIRMCSRVTENTGIAQCPHMILREKASAPPHECQECMAVTSTESVA